MDAYGFAFTSPGLCSPGLLGSQGWSPSSSVYSDDDYNGSQDKRLSVEFPIPPQRLESTRPLSFIKPRAVSAKVTLHSKAIEAWEVKCQELESEKSGLDGLGIMTPRKKVMMRKNKPSYVPLPPTYSRRVFSLPAPPPAYSDIQDGDQSPEQEPDEYPFPIMPAPHHDRYYRDLNSDMEGEKEKMRRLQASMNLLSFQRDHHDDEANSPSSPLQQLSFKRKFLSPEHRAPTLAEQMAYACGLGSQCDWSSPNKLVRASSDIYLPTTTQEISTNAQEERKMASRHIRQVVAANGSAPMTRNVSMQSCFNGEEAEVGSSWSHSHSHKSHGEEEEGDEDQYWLRSNTPMSRTLSLHSVANSAAIMTVNSSPILHGALSGADFAHHHHHHHHHHYSDSSSGGDSEVDSPSTCVTSVQSHQALTHGNWSKSKVVEIECLFAEGLALQEEEDYHSSGSSSSGSESIGTPVDSPNSLYEFSYIIDSEQFTHVDIPSPVKVCGDDGFNGNTFSPPLNTPDLNTFPATPIGFAASPVLDQSSIEPHPTVIKDYATRSFLLPELSLPSTTSILERPRPYSRSAMTPFFGGADVKLVQKIITTGSNLSMKRQTFESRRPSVMTSVKSQPEIPIRRSSLESAMSSTSSSHNSVQAFYEETSSVILSKRNDQKFASTNPSVDMPKSVTMSKLAFSQSEINLGTQNNLGNQRLSPKALAQVREACRAKADFVRNNALNKAEAEEEAAAEARLALLKIKEQMKNSISRHPALVRSGQSEPANLNAYNNDKQRPQYHKKATTTMTKKQVKMLKKKTSTNSVHIRFATDLVDEGPIKSRSRSNSTLSISVADSVKVPLPTLFVARTNSQRRKGITGIPATEPSSIALANLGFKTGIATRQSKVEALINKSDALQEGGLLRDMPNGVILIVEEHFTNESRLLV